MTVRIFLSHSSKDRQLCDQLEAHLSSLQHEGIIHSWHRRQVTAGERTDETVSVHFEAAQIILPLISADYLASDHCNSAEMARALARESQGQVRVVPIILRACDWQATPFAKYKALPQNAVAVTSWSNRDKAWSDVVIGIRALAQESIQATRRRPEPNYPDLRTRNLSEQIEQARTRKRALQMYGVDTSEIDREIMEFRRQLRDGGRLKAGDSLGNDRYLLLNQIGRGGFAIVWDAHDRERDTHVAIKVLHSNLAGDRVRLERFFRGAQSMAELSHPAILPVLQQYGEDGGYHYFVMALASQGDMRRAVRERGLSPDEVVNIITRVGEALSHAHSKMLVHRDVKPSNILLDSQGEPLLTDFDLVWAPDTTGGTRTGALGTIIYAAPELLEHPEAPDMQVDVYGLGMTAVFGFYGADLPISVLRKSKEFVDKLACSEPVKDVLKGAVEWEKTIRFRSVVEFCTALGMAYRAVPDELPRFVHLDRKSLSVGASHEMLGVPMSSLRGEDLSGRILRAADLNNIDLTDVKLCRADLSDASLRNARLVRTDLSGARLQHVDLSCADLSFARARDVDLRGARLAGARLRATDLLGAKLDSEALNECNPLGAALPNMGHAELMFASASPCNVVAYDGSGELLASGHTDGTIRLWDAGAGIALRVLRGHEAAVVSVSFSPNGATLASGSEDSTIRFWDVASGKELRVLGGHPGFIWCVTFSPDGTMLASGSDDGAVRLWDVSTGGEERVMLGHEAAVVSLSFSPRGTVIVSGSDDTTVRFRSVCDSADPIVCYGHDGPVLSVTFSPGGEMAASGSDDGTIRLWEVATGAECGLLRGRDAVVSSVAFGPEGKILASGSDDMTVSLWNMISRDSPYVLHGHQAHVRSVAFSPDGTILASGSDDKTIRLWNVMTLDERIVMRSHDASLWDLAITAHGEQIITASNDGSMRCWDVVSGVESRVLRAHGAPVGSVALGPDGTTLAGGCDGGTVRIWDLVAGVERAALRGQRGNISTLAFAPDGAMVASSGSSDRAIWLWDLATRTEQHILRGHTGAIWSVKFAPDGSLVASASEDKSVRLWEVSTGSEQRVLRGHSGPVLGVAFNADGGVLASGSDDSTIRLWSVATGAERLVLRAHASAVWCVAFDPVRDVLASGSDDRTIRLWEASTGTQLLTLRGHDGPISRMAFAPDGSRLFSASRDGTVRVWNAVTGNCLGVLLSLPEGWAAMSSEGRYKMGGVCTGALWLAMGLCRFEPGEIDQYVTEPLRLSDELPLFASSG